jgi:hypothetical protein
MEYGLIGMLADMTIYNIIKVLGSLIAIGLIIYFFKGKLEAEMVRDVFAKIVAFESISEYEIVGRHRGFERLEKTMELIGANFSKQEKKTLTRLGGRDYVSSVFDDVTKPLLDMADNR